jgi:hypothetical protein
MKSAFVVVIALIGCTVTFAGTGHANAPASPQTAFEQTLMDSEKGFIEAA